MLNDTFEHSVAILHGMNLTSCCVAGYAGALLALWVYILTCSSQNIYWW